MAIWGFGGWLWVWSRLRRCPVHSPMAPPARRGSCLDSARDLRLIRMGHAHKHHLQRMGPVRVGRPVPEKGATCLPHVPAVGADESTASAVDPADLPLLERPEGHRLRPFGHAQRDPDARSLRRLRRQDGRAMGPLRGADALQLEGHHDPRRRARSCVRLSLRAKGHEIVPQYTQSPDTTCVASTQPAPFVIGPRGAKREPPPPPDSENP
jgi:hypothetical protein